MQSFGKKILHEILIDLFNPETIYERSDSDVRLKEGLEQRNGIIYGKDPQELTEVEENGNKFLVDIKNGHKTGFYLDQRDNRKILSEFCSEMNVLNCFSYSGGFSVYAVRAEH
ncbi:MAG: class I SAM-dependent methyltransferase [Ignavibacteriales bacterium]|nr:class I SAM-dependent methyltransferase [Ignavibacteriales bacterium]